MTSAVLEVGLALLVLALPLLLAWWLVARHKSPVPSEPLNDNPPHSPTSSGSTE